MSIKLLVTVVFVCSLLIGCVSQKSSSDTKGFVQIGSTGSSLYEGIDRYGKTITTDSTEAQLWFNQGFQLIYGFNHGEAVRSFKEAAARDPKPCSKSRRKR